MTLYILGNGFDLAHKLPTAYWDFRTYLKSAHPEFLEAFEEHYDIYPSMSDEAKKEYLWNRFESNLANIDEDSIIESGTSIEMDLESGDVGIEDTLYSYFTNEYQYIQKLSVYLKEWVRTIRIRDCLPRTSKIKDNIDDLFLTFNYTATLENVYLIRPDKVIHIHGSLRDYTPDPVIGHGNKMRIDRISKKIEEAESLFDEKWVSICRVVRDYYSTTLKNTDKYSGCLERIRRSQPNEIIVVGHSLDGIDLPYFTLIDNYTDNKNIWTIVVHRDKEKLKLVNSLVTAGIDRKRIRTIPSGEFFDLDDTAAAHRITELRYRFLRHGGKFCVNAVLAQAKTWGKSRRIALQIRAGESAVLGLVSDENGGMRGAAVNAAALVREC